VSYVSMHHDYVVREYFSPLSLQPMSSPESLLLHRRLLLLQLQLPRSQYSNPKPSVSVPREG